MENANATPLWKHNDPSSTRTDAFRRHVESTYGVKLKDYEELRLWSILNINSFWEEVWHFTKMKSSKPFTKVHPNETIPLTLLAER